MEYKIGVIPGDGVGPEVIEEGLKVLNAVEDVTKGLSFSFEEFPHGSDYYLENNELISEDDLNRLEKKDSIYLGALGDPRVETGILEQGILLKIRFYFDQYINLRPVKLYPGVPCPLKNKGPEDVDFYVVRENTEDFYVALGDRVKDNTSKELELKRELYNIKFDLDLKLDMDEIAYQIGVISRRGAERAIRFSFELSEKKNLEKLASVDKANVLSHMYGLWRDVFREVAMEYPHIETEFFFIDAINMWLVKSPELFKLIVTPNMFGDIITDLGGMIQGGLGMAPGGNINPEGVSMFEPIHGSAPVFAGKNEANPIAAILAGQMMLEDLGEQESADLIEKTVIEILNEGKVLTRDICGNSSTSEVGDAIANRIRSDV